MESVNLQVATYSKFQPQSPDFLDITNPKAVLENALRNFACLTTGDVIAINYNEKIYELRVMETKPDKAVSIIECDMNVDFDAPLGYKEPERQIQHEESAEGEADHGGYAGELGFRAFSGSGNRLDGKKKGVEPSPSPIKPGDIKEEFPIMNLNSVRSRSSEIHVHWSKRLKRMKLEADSSPSLEKGSHCVKREESHRLGLLADWKIK